MSCRDPALCLQTPAKTDNGTGPARAALLLTVTPPPSDGLLCQFLCPNALSSGYTESLNPTGLGLGLRFPINIVTRYHGLCVDGIIWNGGSP